MPKRVRSSALYASPFSWEGALRAAVSVLLEAGHLAHCGGGRGTGRCHVRTALRARTCSAHKRFSAAPFAVSVAVQSTFRWLRRVPAGAGAAERVAHLCGGAAPGQGRVWAGVPRDAPGAAQGHGARQAQRGALRCCVRLLACAHPARAHSLAACSMRVCLARACPLTRACTWMHASALRPTCFQSNQVWTAQAVEGSERLLQQGVPRQWPHSSKHTWLGPSGRLLPPACGHESG